MLYDAKTSLHMTQLFRLWENMLYDAKTSLHMTLFTAYV